MFSQSSKTLLDLAAAMGTEPKAAAVQLGKALTDDHFNFKVPANTDQADP